ncbi:MAG: [protein-PII] uridylyltransferase [Candidatus Latescibacteria bacterium]|nr:[protein-PII] uridylyltransferase [Candidatus Latescibacterota bacterium]
MPAPNPFQQQLRTVRAERPQDDLGPVLKDFWILQSNRLKEQRHDHQGVELAQSFAQLVDALVLALYKEFDASADLGPHALVAQGGYGRGEMAPFSDVDLLFLFKKKNKAQPFVAAVLHPLWDLGFDIGHGTRTLGEVRDSVRQDLESCTAMMTSRLLAGDRDFFATYQTKLYKSIPKATVAQLQKWRQDRLEQKDSVQLLDPNIKESPGGLRDLDALQWALQARSGTANFHPLRKRYLDAEDVAALEKNREFLWRVRHELHAVVGRSHDLLQHDLKPTIAANLGYTDNQELGVERFMRDYYLHARSVYHLVELVFGRLLRKKGPRRSRVLEAGVFAVDSEIVVPEGAEYFAAQPLRLLSVFHLSQAKNLPLSEDTQRVIGSCLHLIDDSLRRSPAARDIFLRILRRKLHTAATLRTMHELGVLGAYLPEFGDLTCLVQYDIYHLYTADEHTLLALQNIEDLDSAPDHTTLKQVLVQIKRRDLLFLGVLLHDIGKSRRQDHVAAGLEMTRTLLQRLDLPEADALLVLFLVEHHQDMSAIAQRRDLDDPKLIAEFAGLFVHMEWLHMLYLTTYADMSAVARGIWTDWQGALLWELYYKTSQQLESGLNTLEERQQSRQLLEQHLGQITHIWPAPQVVAFEEHVTQLPARYMRAYHHDQIGTHLELLNRLNGSVEVAFEELPSVTELIICSHDQRQLLAKICGAIAANDINILRADVHTRNDGQVLDIFQVTDIDGTPHLPQWKKERVRKSLEEVTAGQVKARDLLQRHSTTWDRRKKTVAPLRPPTVDFENQVSDKYTVIDTDVHDDVGLLYTITYALGELDLDIHMAIINTTAERATDAFYVVDRQGEKIVNYEFLETIRQHLLDKLEG